MSKRSIFTTVTPLPAYITRETVIETLHQHSEMIELNPLVIKHEKSKPPPNAPPDEYHCTWYELTDKVHYLPGGLLSGNVTYKACFHDLPRGLQTHVYAPTGLDIKDKWSVGGNMPHEPRETIELGLKDAPREGLYLREDVDMRCNVLASSFVKKTLKKAHSVLVDRLVMKADMLKEEAEKQKRLSVASSPGYGSTHSSAIIDSELFGTQISPRSTGQFSSLSQGYAPQNFPGLPQLHKKPETTGQGQHQPVEVDAVGPMLGSPMPTRLDGGPATKKEHVYELE